MRDSELKKQGRLSGLGSGASSGAPIFRGPGLIAGRWHMERTWIDVRSVDGHLRNGNNSPGCYLSVNRRCSLLLVLHIRGDDGLRHIVVRKTLFGDAPRRLASTISFLQYTFCRLGRGTNVFLNESQIVELRIDQIDDLTRIGALLDDG